MVPTQIREEIHQLVNEADERDLFLMYTFLKSQSDSEGILTEEQERQLAITVNMHKKGLSKSYTWAEARAMIERRR